jgi:CDP-diacylglycerol--glycerol-3-phosphate 3-phosphatidyltransferase
LVGVALVTDALDGFLARRWTAETALGRRLDRWGDVLTMSFAAIGVSLIWPDEIGREWLWVLVALAGYAVGGVRRFTQPRTTPPPSWRMKALGLPVPLSLVVLLAEGMAWPFRVAAVVQLATGVIGIVRGRRGNAGSVGGDLSLPAKRRGATG